MINLMRDKERISMSLGNPDANYFLDKLNSLEDKERAKDILNKIRNKSFLRGEKLGFLFILVGRDMEQFYVALNAIHLSKTMENRVKNGDWSMFIKR